MEGKKIYSQMWEISKEIEPIKKERQNTQQGYKFRSIDDVYNALQPLLAKHGVIITSKVLDKKIESIEKPNKSGVIFKVNYEIEYSFVSLKDGSEIKTAVCGGAVDYSDKETAKAFSNAYKTAILQIFSIPTDDIEDSDKNDISQGDSKVQYKGATKSLDNLRKQAVAFVNNTNWPKPKKDAIIKGMNNHNETYLRNLLDGKIS